MKPKQHDPMASLPLSVDGKRRRSWMLYFVYFVATVLALNVLGAS
jgi:hypothetical protein